MAFEKPISSLTSQQVLFAQSPAATPDLLNLPKVPNLEPPPLAHSLMSAERTTQPRQQEFPAEPIQMDASVRQEQRQEVPPIPQSTMPIQPSQTMPSFQTAQSFAAPKEQPLSEMPAPKEAAAAIMNHKRDSWLESVGQKHGVTLSPEAIEGYHKIGNFSKEAAAYGGSTFGQYVAWCSQHGIPTAMAEEINLTGAPNDMLRNALNGVNKTTEQLSRLDPEMHKALGEAIKHMPAVQIQVAETTGPDGVATGAKPQGLDTGRGV